MLQGGVSVNKYHRLRSNKNRMKERYAKKYSYGCLSWRGIIIEHENDLKQGHHFNDLSYWKEYYLSGRRNYSKFSTNRKIRQMNRSICQSAMQLEDAEDCGVQMRNADYRKYFDYDWTVW